MASSFQQIEPGSPASAAPAWLRGSHSATTAPVGSCSSAIRPTSSTSNGSISAVPPSSFARRATSLALATEM